MDTGRRPAGRPQPRGRLLHGAATIAAIAIGAAALAGFAGAVDAGSRPGLRDVEVPLTAFGDVANPDPTASVADRVTDTSPASTRGFRRPEVDCAPTGCARWSIAVGHGRAQALSHGVYHLGRDTFTALNHRDGSVRWRVNRPSDSARFLQPRDGRLADRGPLLTVTDTPGLQAWDPSTGTLLWEAPWAVDVRVRSVEAVADALVFVVSGAFPTRPLDDPAEPDDVGVVALAAADGDLRWAHAVDEVVSLDQLLVQQAGRLVALDVVTGSTRWQHAAVTVGDGPVGGEVVVTDSSGVSVLDATTGAREARVDVDLAATLLRHPPGSGTTPVRADTRGGLVLVGAIRDDTAGPGQTDEWVLGFHERNTGLERRRIDRVTHWWWPARGPLLVVTATDDTALLHGVATSDGARVLWTRELPAPAANVWFEDNGRDHVLVAVSAARTDVEVLQLDPVTGEDLHRYGGDEWEPVGRGLLGHSVSWPTPGSARVLELAGPDGVIEFSRRVRVVSSEPALVSYWDTLIRLDEQLLVAGPPPRRTPNKGPR